MYWCFFESDRGELKYTEVILLQTTDSLRWYQSRKSRYMPVIPVFGKQRWEDQGFEASQVRSGYVV